MELLGSMGDDIDKVDGSWKSLEFEYDVGGSIDIVREIDDGRAVKVDECCMNEPE